MTANNLKTAILKNAKSEELQDLILHDVAPLSIGQADHDDVMQVFIKRNTPIPVKVVRRDWTTVVDNQTQVVVDVSLVLISPKRLRNHFRSMRASVDWPRTMSFWDYFVCAEPPFLHLLCQKTSIEFYFFLNVFL